MTGGVFQQSREMTLEEKVEHFKSAMLTKDRELREVASDRDAWEASADGYRRMFDEQCSRAQGFRALLALFVDNEECRFDHHGNCQNHGIGWDDTSPGECSMAAVRAALASPGEET